MRRLSTKSQTARGPAFGAAGVTQRDAPHFVRAYEEHTRKLLQSCDDREGALAASVGSATREDFEAIGKMEKALLIYAGLQPDHSLVDVGCGSGRLAVQLRDWLSGQYLGTDVVQELLDEAARLCNRSDWRFAKVSGLTVPAESDSVDMACAFSVFTHLRHEESYVYLQDIYRVLKPGGQLVFSFLEFRVPLHWGVMEGNIAAIGTSGVLNQFMGVDAVEAFADHLGFEVMEINRGDAPFIPMTDADDATTTPALSTLGQSVAIYRKPHSLS